jgi:hypothetical protein
VLKKKKERKKERKKELELDMGARVKKNIEPGNQIDFN